MPQWLADQGAEVLIVGSMGYRERDLFSDRGIRTILGAPPETSGQLVAAYVAGSLRRREDGSDR